MNIGIYTTADRGRFDAALIRGEYEIAHTEYDRVVVEDAGAYFTEEDEAAVLEFAQDEQFLPIEYRYKNRAIMRESFFGLYLIARPDGEFDIFDTLQEAKEWIDR